MALWGRRYEAMADSAADGGNELHVEAALSVGRRRRALKGEGRMRRAPGPGWAAAAAKVVQVGRA